MSAAVVLALACACDERAAARPVGSVTIAAGTNPDFSLVHVAKAKGYFAAEGVDVTLQPHEFGRLALAAVLEGKADLAACAETPVVFAEVRGHRVSVLASIGTSTRNMAVVARRDAGIERPADLAGKRIGVTPGTSGAFFLDSFLLRHGLGRTSVRLVEKGPSEMGDAMGRDEVDAAATWSPAVLGLLQRFDGRVQAFYELDLYEETGVLAARRGFSTERPDAVRAVLRALLRAEALFRERPEEARQAVLGSQRQPGPFVDEMLRQFDFRVRLDQGLLVLLEEEARWAGRLVRVEGTEPPDMLEVLDPAPLLSVSPARVGLIR